MSEFKPIETQEQFDAAITDRIRRAQDAVRREYADYDQLKEQVADFDGVKSEYETRQQQLEQTVAAQGAAIKRYETEALKRKVADEVGIPAAFASRLTGEDEDSIRQDALALAPMLKGRKTPPLRDPDAKPTGETGYRRMLAGLKGD